MDIPGFFDPPAPRTRGWGRKKDIEGRDDEGRAELGVRAGSDGEAHMGFFFHPRPALKKVGKGKPGR